MLSRRILFSLGLLASLAGCADPPTDPSAEPEAPGGKADGVDDPLPAQRPKRVILMIGDGMGAGSLTAAEYASEMPLHILSMSSVSFVTTHEHEFVTTDSAAAATALATGTKTHFGGIGVLPGTSSADEDDADRQLFTLLDAARAQGLRTGVVTTASIVDATPAAFMAHRAKRKSKEEIAVDIRHSDVDVLIGGGRERFEGRDDGQNLLNQMRDSAGYAVAKTATGLRRHSGSKTRVVGLLHEGDMPPVTTGDREMPLAEIVSETIEILDTENPEGYVLVIEGAQIDRRGHSLDAVGNVAETLDFDAAVGVALEYARGRDDTLVVVTADHETAGVTVLDGEAAEPMMDAFGGREEALAQSNFPGGEGPDAFSSVPALSHGEGAEIVVGHGDMSTASRPLFSGLSRFFFATHTPTMVPLLAEGTAATFVARARDNAELGARLLALVEADDGADREAEPEPADEDPRNVVLVVADGVGLPTWTAAHYSRGRQAAEDMAVRGLATTHASDRILGDSVSAGTAWATGRSVGRGELTADAPSLLSLAEQAGRSTGVVTTAPATAAALAPFVEASSTDAVAQAMVEFSGDSDGLDVVLAGGASAFDDELQVAWQERGAEVMLQWDGDLSSDGPAVRLVSADAMAPASEREDAEQPSLREMTTAALSRLSEDEDGFVLVVYAPGVAGRAADMDFSDAFVDEMDDLDGAVAAALEFAATDDETLVVVSSAQDGSMSILDNHYGFHRKHCGIASRCNGPETLFDLALAFGKFVAGAGFEDADLQGDFADLSVIVQGSWLPFRAQAIGGPVEVHSANLVPVFAHGPGAEQFGSVQHQAELGARLRDLL